MSCWTHYRSVVWTGKVLGFPKIHQKTKHSGRREAYGLSVKVQEAGRLQDTRGKFSQIQSLCLAKIRLVLLFALSGWWHVIFSLASFHSALDQAPSYKKCISAELWCHNVSYSGVIIAWYTFSTAFWCSAFDFSDADSRNFMASQQILILKY